MSVILLDHLYMLYYCYIIVISIFRFSPNTSQ